MPRSPRQYLSWFILIALITLNLRPFMTSVGPMVSVIQTDSGISLQTLSWLVTLPVALMGLGTWLTPSFAKVFGSQRTLFLGIFLLFLGVGLRFVSHQGGLLIATAVIAGCGIAFIQGILPGLIKWKTPQWVSPMMGLYSASLMTGGALGAQFSPLAYQWGLTWQASLAIWAVLALFALVVAFLQRHQLPEAQPLRFSSASRGSTSVQPLVSEGTRWLYRKPRTWSLILYFGLMNSGYASVIAWLSPYYANFGWNIAKSGWLVVLVSIAQALTALILPFMMRRLSDKRVGLVFTLMCQLVGFAGIAWWPLEAPQLWAVFLGIGLGGCFAVIMGVALDHLASPFQAGALSAYMQGAGYIIAALGPWAMVQLKYLTGGFMLGWVAHAVLVLLLIGMSFIFSEKSYRASMARNNKISGAK